MEAPTIVEKCGVYLRSQCSSRHVLRDDIFFDNFMILRKGAEAQTNMIQKTSPFQH
jgi:hypothetical protein